MDDRRGRELPPEIFAAAIAAELPRLRRFARVLMRPAEAADDLVQETLLRAIAARRQFASGSNLRAWLFVICRNARNAELRRLRNQPTMAEEAGHLHPGVSGGQEERQRMRDLAYAFNRLPPQQREALWLVVVEGVDYGQAARVLGIPIGTVRSRLSRARDALRTAIGD